MREAGRDALGLVSDVALDGHSGFSLLSRFASVVEGEESDTSEGKTSQPLWEALAPFGPSLFMPARSPPPALFPAQQKRPAPLGWVLVSVPLKLTRHSQAILEYVHESRNVSIAEIILFSGGSRFEVSKYNCP